MKIHIKDGVHTTDLPIVDVNVALMSLVAASVTEEGGKRVIKGEFLGGGSFTATIHLESGKFSLSAEKCSTQLSHNKDDTGLIASIGPKDRPQLSS